MRDSYDILVYGNGLSALAAALWLAEAGRPVAIADGLGDKVDLMARIEPSVLWPRWMRGHELVWNWRDRVAPHLDLVASLPLYSLDELHLDRGRVVFRGAFGETATTKHLILAVDGMQPGLLDPSFTRLWGRGLSQCASSDAAFFSNEHVVVAGNGDLALHQAVLAAEHASRVTLLTSRRVTPPEWLARLVAQSTNIEWRCPAQVVAVHADSAGSLARVDISVDDNVESLAARGLFHADDPVVTPELRALAARLASPAVSFAGALNGIPWNAHAALVEDGIRAARSV